MFREIPPLRPEKKPEQEKEKEKVEIVSDIGANKRTPEQIEKFKRIREEIEEEREIREKLKRGELPSQKEAARLREIEIIAEARKREKEQKEKGVSFEDLEKKPEQEEEKEKVEEVFEQEKEKKPEQEKEKAKEVPFEDLEKNLEEKRNSYIEVYNDYRRAFGRMKKKELAVLEEAIEAAKKHIKAGDSEILKDEKSLQYSEAIKRKEDFINELTKGRMKKEKAELIYNAELKKAEYEKAKERLGRKMLVEGKEEAEIFQKLILEEREALNKAKIEAWPPKEKGIFKKCLEWWMRKGTATRLLISTSLVTGIVAVAGGFSAPAIALFAGQRYIRGAGAVLAGKLAGKGVDWAMEKNIKAKEEAALDELKRDFSLETLRDVDKKYERILEEIAGKRRKKLLVKAGVMAVAGAATAVGLRFLENYIAAETPASSPKTPAEMSPKPRAEALAAETPSKPTSEAAAEQATIKVNDIETAQKGDSIWKMAERQLEVRYSEKFTGLNEARKTYIIDAIKDKIAAKPEKFGLADIDEIKIGQKIDFSSIFEDKTEIDKVFIRANALVESQIKNIEHNNEVLIRYWLETSPDEKLTSEKIEEILKKSKTVLSTEPSSSAEIGPLTKELPSIKRALPAEDIVLEETLEELEKIKQEPSIMELQRIMELNETAIVKSIGFTFEEYEAIKNLKIGKLLEQISSPKEAWAIWKGEIPGKEIDLSYYKTYEAKEFERLIKLAEFIRGFKPGMAIKEMTVGQFLRMVGPAGTILV